MLTIIRDPRPWEGRLDDEPEKPHVVLILDETQSMDKHRDKVISTFNEFVQSVKHTAKTVSLYTFNSMGLRERMYMAPPEKIQTLTNESYNPNWNTPLYDAMGMVMRVFETSDRKVQLVTHTDGEENCSKSWTYSNLSDFIKRMTERGWLFVYLAEGVTAQREMDKFAGVKVHFSSGMRGQTMSAVGDITRSYVACSAQEVQIKTNGGIIDIDKGEGLKP